MSASLPEPLPEPLPDSQASPSRPASAPYFLLSRAHRSGRAQGTAATFQDPWAAVDALHRGEADIVVGALPFSRDDAAALTTPATFAITDGPLEPHAYYRTDTRALGGRIIDEDPEEEEHLRRVEAAVATIAHSRLDKVVLARAVDIAFDSPIDPLLVASRLIDASPNKDGLCVDLTPAGPRYRGVHLVGSSPEVLVRRHGTTVSAFPLAGSAPRHRDPQADRAAAAQLQASAKDRAEHRFVVDHLRACLTPLCTELHIPDQPELTCTKDMWHLATPITGTVKPNTTALELALATHPTPAICGTPTDPAADVIATIETDRGFYAGAVGWCTANGDGEYMVAIRCAQISAGGTRARAWAGGGIVAESDPEAELAETTAKLHTMLRALGLG